VIEGSGHYWNLASAFALDGLPTGVMTAATVPPIAVCSLRQDEPLLRLPKAASVTRYRLAGRTETLLVANIHSVNFTLALDAYVGQLEALVTELAEHRGPLILAGDLNTWTDRRREAVEAAAAALRLDEVALAPDHRRLFLGKQVDRVYVRGLETLAARAIEVRSSDHNPVSALLRVSASGG
jgi:endonuclease/exonuclease/phosphatase (EEP) superfamily protein YafD